MAFLNALAYLLNFVNLDGMAGIRPGSGNQPLPPVRGRQRAVPFLRGGGVVTFVIDQGHVRFDVNRRVAEQHGLRLSSRLLRAARSAQ